MKKSNMKPEWMGNSNRMLGIVRRSSKGQEGNTSEKSQIKSLREYARKHGLNLVKIITITESAKDSELRNKYRAAQAWADKNDVRHRAYAILDREARNLTDTETSENDIRKDKYVNHYVAEDKQLYWNSPDSDFLMRDYQAVNNKHYSRSLGTKVRTAAITKAEEGDYPGCHTPLGYIHQKKKNKRGAQKRRGTKVEASTHKKDVDQVVREYELRGEVFPDDPKRVRSLREIREQIIKEGFIPVGEEKNYHTGTIHRRLTNKFYDQRFDWKGIEYPGNQPRLFSKELFWRVQETFGLKNPYQKKSDGSFGGGWLKCAQCGCHIVYDPKEKTLKNGKEVTYHHYHCTNGKKAHATSAGMRVHEEKIWEQFKVAVDQVSISETFAKEILDAVNDAHLAAQATIKREMQRYSDALQALEGEEDRIYADYRKGVLDDAGHNRLVQKVREQRKDFTQQLERAQLMINDTGMSTVKSTLELAINVDLSQIRI